MINFKGNIYDNNLHRSLSRLYTIGYYGIANNTDKSELKIHLNYLRNWIKKHGGKLP